MMSAAALLWPLMAEPESHIQTGAANASSSATAHVNFKIVIPKVLYLRLGSENDRGGGADTVGIVSNSRNVMLSVTVRPSDDDGSGAGTHTPMSSAAARNSANTANPTSAEDARGSVILSAPARKVIVQDAACTLGGLRPAAAPLPARRGVAGDSSRLVCTASMP